MGNPAYSKKQEHLSNCVSRRFANPKQELKVQTIAGVIRDAVKGKGGYNSPKAGHRPYGEKRVKKTPYKWGTLGLSSVSEAIKKDQVVISKRSIRRRMVSHNSQFVAYTIGKAITQLPFKVIQQAAKAHAYKDKISSRKWRKAAGDR
ncbi:hypothetical protein EHS13_20120 [Paenibacillus psychroresistens]|uniref:Uncharacterized protein n=1 Tax=Paenibacillus psychroresistens TaxID=1778678 RepID=A0A6B8RNA2_9BACL|nr:hypothetical protein [Paenibacillus psychroresistens]QGQ97025.1 hypothetical protein EHS13_20120 [Paenibacillus psychroresistens]